MPMRDRAFARAGSRLLAAACRRPQPPKSGSSASTATSRSSPTARSTSPRRSTSVPRMSRSTAASTATSRPATTRRGGGRVRVGFDAHRRRRSTASRSRRRSKRSATASGSASASADKYRRRRASTATSSATGRRGSSAASTDYRRALLERHRQRLGSSRSTGRGARSRFPRPVRFGQRASYTGPQGSTGQRGEGDRRRSRARSGSRRRAPLGPDEGLTVAVAWPKGVVAEPTASSRLAWLLADYGPPLVGAAGLLGRARLSISTPGSRAGRDPRAGTVVPLFSPPDDLSPGGDALHRRT